VRLRVRFPGADRDSEDVYAKVLVTRPADGMQRAQVHLTSVDPTDRAAIERILEM